MNESFSAATRRITADADKAMETIVDENITDWRSIPAEYRNTVRQLIRLGYLRGRGDSAQAVMDGCFARMKSAT